MSRKSWFLFFAVGLLWGIPYLLIRVAVNDHIHPSIVVISRVVVGAALLIPFSIRRKTLGAALREWKTILPYAIGEMIIPWFFITTAEQKLSSGLAGLLVATVPIWSTILASINGDKSVWHHKRLLGMFIGFVGIVLVVGVESIKGHADLFSILLILIASVSYAWAVTRVNRKIPHIDSIAINGIAMAMTSLFCLPIALTHLPEVAPTVKADLALVSLGLFPTAFAFVIFFILMKDIGPARASLVTYLNTAFAVVLGVLFLSEKLTLGIIVGLPLVLIGSYFASRKPSVTQ
jgi:drug/metabolite transporter (DMT)-like permease